MTPIEDFGKILQDYRKDFNGPVSDLVKYLADNNIMSKSEIAKQMKISRQTLYAKYLNVK